MYEAETRNIRVSVLPVYIDERSDPEEGRWFWAYQVTIENRGPVTVQLVSRYWHIVDAKGTLVYAGGIDDKPSSNPSDVKTARNHVNAALADIAAGKPVAQAATRPYGCSVKYGDG